MLFIWEWLLFRRDKNLDALNFAKTCHREIKVTLKFSTYTVIIIIHVPVNKFYFILLEFYKVHVIIMHSIVVPHRMLRVTLIVTDSNYKN